MARSIRGSFRRSCYLGVVWLLAAVAPLSAQQGGGLEAEEYLTPPPEIARIVTASRHENVALTNLSPDRRYFLTTVSTGLPTLADYAKKYYNLGGRYIDPRANRARSLTVGTDIGFELISSEDGRKVRIMAPSGAKVSSPKWSPDGKSLAYFVNFPDATYLYVADVSSGKSRRVTGTPALATLVTSFEWVDGGKALVAVLVPEGRGVEPRRPEVPVQPQVRLTQEGENKLRTYASLLADQHDQALLEYYITGQLARIDASNGRVRKIGKPAMIYAVDPSPTGEFFRVTTIQKPFSYVVPVSGFGRVEEIWDLDGKVLAEVEKRPMMDGIRQPPRDTTKVEEGRRSLAWRPDGKGLSYLQLEPAPKRQGRAARSEESQQASPRKDRVMQWLPPFDSASAKVVFETTGQIRSVQYSSNPQLIFITERASGSNHVYAVSLDQPDKKYTIARFRTGNFYTNPGSLMTIPDGRGRGSGVADVVRLSKDGRSVYLSGTKYSREVLSEAPRPFIDRVEIRTGKKERVFESAADRYERVTAVLDDDLKKLVISRESPTEVPNYFLKDRSSGAERQLTQNVDHAPEITQARREVIEVTRADGIKFWVKVTLPRDHQPGTRLPALLWIYPREYTNQAAYDRTKRTHNKNEFPRIGPRTMEILVQAGYAVVLPDVPIIGPSGRMNDNYIHDLRNSLAAVIDELDRRGLVDRNRLAVGGHSYGAFSTVNAMVHTPFFKAGIAGSGNFNRTLTPFAFQSERRELWEARETYLEMSPILRADRLTGALLLYHGMDDQNVGTSPINSPRLFHALDGLGKTAALYLYPYEGHGPATRETLLDLWARWVAWLDKYVKTAGQGAEKVVASPVDDGTN